MGNLQYSLGQLASGGTSGTAEGESEREPVNHANCPAHKRQLPVMADERNERTAERYDSATMRARAFIESLASEISLSTTVRAGEA
jgi:hypothetical protein